MGLIKLIAQNWLNWCWWRGDKILVTILTSDFVVLAVNIRFPWTKVPRCQQNCHQLWFANITNYLSQWELDFGDNFRVLGTEFSYWWHLLNASARSLCSKKEDVGDENGKNRHQHLEVFAKKFRLQHPSSTSSWIAESNLGRFSYQEILSLSRDRSFTVCRYSLLSISYQSVPKRLHWSCTKSCLPSCDQRIF